MNRKELLEKISQETGITQKKADEVINVLIESVEEEVKKGGAVQFKGFATFKRVEVKQCVKKSPKDGKEITVPAHFKMKVSVSKMLKKF